MDDLLKKCILQGRFAEALELCGPLDEALRSELFDLAYESQSIAVFCFCLYARSATGAGSWMDLAFDLATNAHSWMEDSYALAAFFAREIGGAAGAELVTFLRSVPDASDMFEDGEIRSAIRQLESSSQSTPALMALRTTRDASSNRRTLEDSHATAVEETWLREAVLSGRYADARELYDTLDATRHVAELAGLARSSGSVSVLAFCVYAFLRTDAAIWAQAATVVAAYGLGHIHGAFASALFCARAASRISSEGMRALHMLLSFPAGRALARDEELDACKRESDHAPLLVKQDSLTPNLIRTVASVGISSVSLSVGKRVPLNSKRVFRLLWGDGYRPPLEVLADVETGNIEAASLFVKRGDLDNPPQRPVLLRAAGAGALSVCRREGECVVLSARPRFLLKGDSLLAVGEGTCGPITSYAVGAEVSVLADREGRFCGFAFFNLTDNERATIYWETLD